MSTVPEVILARHAACASPRSRRSPTSPRAWAARSSRTSRRCATPKWRRATSLRLVLEFAEDSGRARPRSSSAASATAARSPTRRSRFLVGGITDGGLSDAQVGALAMAFFLRGPRRATSGSRSPTAMRDSGTVLEWDLDRPGARQALDRRRRRQGLADPRADRSPPAARAVPMISGRGLGHTGGTLDKLDAIPGYDVDAATSRCMRARGRARPAARSSARPPTSRPPTAACTRVRDATGTVESIPLIVASILSKKLAEGLDALVMDVKSGSGAFMAAREDARRARRARSSRSPTAPACRPSRCSPTWTRCSARTAGNALEVRESIDYLDRRARASRACTRSRSRSPPPLLVQARPGADDDDGRARGRAGALDAGAAAERFARDGRRPRRPGRPAREPGAHLAAAPRDAAGRARAPGLRRRASTPARSASSSPARRQPPPRGRPDRPRRRALRRRRRSAPRSARTARWRSSTRAATRAPTRPRRALRAAVARRRRAARRRAASLLGRV